MVGYCTPQEIKLAGGTFTRGFMMTTDLGVFLASRDVLRIINNSMNCLTCLPKTKKKKLIQITKKFQK